jgi:hypothetical protein
MTGKVRRVMIATSMQHAPIVQVASVVRVMPALKVRAPSASISMNAPWEAMIVIQMPSVPMVWGRSVVRVMMVMRGQERSAQISMNAS